MHLNVLSDFFFQSMFYVKKIITAFQRPFIHVRLSEKNDQLSVTVTVHAHGDCYKN